MELKSSKQRSVVSSKQNLMFGREDKLTVFEKYSIFYHNIFNYPLKREELNRWVCIYPKTRKIVNLEIEEKSNYFYIKGKSKNITLRIQNEISSLKKKKIAVKASKVISTLPTVLFVGITGSLAMNNASRDSDIDLLIVTKKDTLWITRPLAYFLLFLNKFRIRKPNTIDEKDKLCLNIWLDETSLAWDKKERNIFTAHEMAQIVPLINKDRVYERILLLNKWILAYWPNSIIRLGVNKKSNQILKTNIFLKLVNRFFKLVQQIYMRNKITKEYISDNKALFHPINNSIKIVRQFEDLSSTQ